MRAKIQRNQIKHFKQVPEGSLQDRIQLDVRFPEYPDLPTYGIDVDVTGATDLRAILVAELHALQDRVRAQIRDDALIRDYFDNWGWCNEFEVDELV